MILLNEISTTYEDGKFVNKPVFDEFIDLENVRSVFEISKDKPNKNEYNVYNIEVKNAAYELFGFSNYKFNVSILLCLYKV